MSRSNYDKNVSRLIFQTSDMLNEYEETAKNKEESRILTEAAKLSDAIYTSSGAHAYNQRMRAIEKDRVFSYKNNFINKAFTTVLSECVNKALLLNEEEYSKINPNYKTEISNTISSFLENAKVDSANINKNILTIYEEIVKETPPAELYLTEEDELSIISDHIMSKQSVNNCLDNLCRDVRVRVANIVSKDQQALADEQNTMDYVTNKELSVAPMVPVNPQPMPADAPLPDPESAPTDTAQSEVPPMQDPQMPQPAPMMESATIIKKRAKKCGIVETLAINEANQMLAEGKEYDKTLALANAIKYITILEAIDASGIVEIGPSGYNNILAASGADVKLPSAKLNGDSLVVDEPKFGDNLKDISNDKENAVRQKISDILNNTMDKDLFRSNSNVNVFKTAEVSVKSPEKNFTTTFASTSNPALDLKGKYTNMKGEIFTESELKTFFENQGFDLNYINLDSMAYEWHFTKH